MGKLLDWFKHPKKMTALNDFGAYFKSLSGYSPIYTSYDGGIYELDLCRACIHKKASESSKAIPKLTMHNRNIEYIVSKFPNPLMTASQFYYRLRTIYEIENNAFIVPFEDKYGRTTGLFPVVPSQAEIKQRDGVLYLVYIFRDGEKMAIEYSKVGHIRKHQYKDDFFGSSNRPFEMTAELLGAQNRYAKQAIENGALLRFMGRLNTLVKGEDDAKTQQKNFADLNFKDNTSGFLLFDNRFADIKQIDNKPVLLDPKQKADINASVYSYWGVNEDLLQNKYDEDVWNGFYESELEPFFIQVGEVLTRMFYSKEQIMNGNEVLLTSNRLQYASNTTKVQVAKEGFDRGIFSANEVRELLNMQLLPDPTADRHMIRLEYVEVGKEATRHRGNKEPEPVRDEPAGKADGE